jgi:hypothetical protein
LPWSQLKGPLQLLWGITQPRAFAKGQGWGITQPRGALQLLLRYCAASCFPWPRVGTKEARGGLR